MRTLCAQRTTFRPGPSICHRWLRLRQSTLPLNPAGASAGIQFAFGREQAFNTGSMLNRPKRQRRLPPLNALRAFEMAARHMSFSTAASELNVTQSAISRQIKTRHRVVQALAAFARVDGSRHALRRTVARRFRPDLGGTES